MTSSLQQAVAAAAANKTLKSSSYQTSRGQFETCFAAGLDLSEFGVDDNRTPSSSSLSVNPPVRESAAAQLLRVKEAEKRQKEEEHAADKRMQAIVQERTANIRETIKRKEESNILVNALAQMHGQDTSDTSIYRKHKRLERKLGLTKRSAAVGGNHKAHKKSRRSKH